MEKFIYKRFQLSNHFVLSSLGLVLQNKHLKFVKTIKKLKDKINLINDFSILVKYFQINCFI